MCYRGSRAPLLDVMPVTATSEPCEESSKTAACLPFAGRFKGGSVGWSSSSILMGFGIRQRRSVSRAPSENASPSLLKMNSGSYRSLRVSLCRIVKSGSGRRTKHARVYSLSRSASCLKPSPIGSGSIRSAEFAAPGACSRSASFQEAPKLGTHAAARCAELL